MYYVDENSNLLTVKSAVIAASSSGANAIVAAVTGKKIRVLGYIISGVTAVNAKWQSGSTDIGGLIYIGATGGAVAPIAPMYMWFETVAGEALNLNLSGAVAVGGGVVYVEVP